MKATVIFFPNKAKKNSKSGKVPIYMRVCYKRSKSESRLNTEIHEKELLKWDPITMRLQERNSPVNFQLSRLDQKFNDFKILHSTCLPQFSARSIRNYILGIDEEKTTISLLDYVDQHFNNAVLKNVNCANGTIKNYRRAINHLRAYLIYTNKETMPLDKLDMQFANDFKNFLVNANPTLDRAGMTEVSAATIIKKFRTIFSLAVDQELIKKNHFKLVKIKTKSPRKERLSLDQVLKIRSLDLSLYQYIPIYRDIFLFSVYTGLAYKDLTSLTWAQIEQRNDGNFKLVVRREKTDVMTECFLPQPAIEIILKYRNSIDTEVTNKVFPYRSNKEVNSQLKMLAQLAGIPIRMTMHTARHSFRQLIAEAGVFDMGVIKRMMGQSRNGDVDEVYYQVTEKSLLLAQQQLTNCLNNQLC